MPVAPESAKANPAKSDSARAVIIRAVESPIGFFALTVLVVEVLLTAFAGLSGGIDRTIAISGALFIIVLLVICVTFLTRSNPESLIGFIHDSDSGELPVFGGFQRFQKVVLVDNDAAKNIARGLESDITNNRRVLTEYEVGRCDTTGYHLDRIGLYIWKRHRSPLQPEQPFHIRQEFQLVERTDKNKKPTLMPLYYALESYEAIISSKQDFPMKVLQDSKRDFQNMLKFLKTTRTDLDKNGKVKAKLEALIAKAAN
jgi:hypothetical protein